jgi:hypothetical protein
MKILEDSYSGGGEGQGRNNIKVDIKNTVYEAVNRIKLTHLIV